MMKKNQIIIYQAEDGTIRIETRFENETVWLNMNQIAELFQRDRSVVAKHIRNISKEGELAEKVVSANFAHTTQHGAIEGKTQTKAVNYFDRATGRDLPDGGQSVGDRLSPTASRGIKYGR